MTPKTAVLLIDHGNPSLREALRSSLARTAQSFTILNVEDTPALESQLARQEAQCLICCLRSGKEPAADAEPAGMQALLHMRTHPAGLPVIMLLDAADEAGWADTVLAHGAEDYLLLHALHRLPQAILAVLKHRQAEKLISAPSADYQLALTVLHGSSDGICITDQDAKILLVNDAFERMTGYAKREVVGENPRVLQSDKHDKAFYERLWASLTTTGLWQGEICNKRKDGSLFSEWLRISAVHNESGAITHYIGQFGYITEQKELIERIHQLTRFDALTGLPNRRFLVERLEQALLESQRNTCNIALMLINIDRFRLINDSLGNEVGDQVLITLAQRFGLHIRQGDTVARMSGNEFCFLLAHLDEAEDALKLAERLQAIIAAPIQHEGHSLIISASFGISVAPRDGSSANVLLRSADAALVRTKHHGGNNISFYSSKMDETARRHQSIEEQLRTALAHQEFHLLYQPQNSLDSGNIIGCEALLRWNNPALGQIGPAEFIPVAEDTGLILAIGLWVLREACLQNKAWQDLGLSQLRVAVNLSARQFQDEHLAEEVAMILAETGLAPEYLELEITESALIHDVDAAIATSQKLKALGLKLSLDDFGTGYSSLTYVSRFPFDKLKIDQSFVRNITHNPADAAIATAAIAMARGLNLSVLAEGVETEAQALFLRSRHCEAMQGYLFNRPLAPETFARLLADNSRLILNDACTDHEQTLLIVDDEPSILSSLNRLFRHENFHTLTTTSCATAFELLAQHPTQVIISDQRMAGMTGTEFFAKVRQLYPDTIRIILSGYTELESVMDAINRGAVYKFLTKPWEDDQLREHIRAAFRAASHKDLQ